MLEKDQLFVETPKNEKPIFGTRKYTFDSSTVMSDYKNKKRYSYVSNFNKVNTSRGLDLVNRYKNTGRNNIRRCPSDEKGQFETARHDLGRP
jgi:hypothetical protein